MITVDDILVGVVGDLVLPPKRRPPPKTDRATNVPSTFDGLASRPEIIAMFSMVAFHDTQTLSHLIRQRRGHYDLWQSTAESFADACHHANADAAMLRLGDAQCLRYVRNDRRAIVVVVNPSDPINKSILRTMRAVLKNLAKEETP